VIVAAGVLIASLERPLTLRLPRARLRARDHARNCLFLLLLL
jgi:hypothetical protein